MSKYPVIKKVGNTREYKTGSWKTMKPVVISEKCIGCGKCWLFCPENCINEIIKNKKKIFEADLDYCKGCGICAEVCPVKAIIMKEDEE